MTDHHPDFATRPAGRLRRAVLAALLAAPLVVPTVATAQSALPEPVDTEEPLVTLAVFSADSENRGRELWITDGTRPGTRLLRDIVRGRNGSHPQNLTALGDGRVVFSAHRPVKLKVAFDNQPWITDGTRAGTRLIRRTTDTLLQQAAPKFFSPLGDGRAVFVAQGDGTGTAWTLWVTNGLRRGTRPLMTNLGAVGAFTALGNGRVVFSHTTAEHGAEIWVTNGTPRGTRLLRDINPGTGSGFFSWFRIAPLGDGRALFAGYDATHGTELWVTDGTPRNTRMVADLQPGIYGSGPEVITPIGGGRALFTGSLDPFGRRIWITDGTAAGTRMLNLPLNPPRMAHLGDGRVVFPAYVDYQLRNQLHVTDGTEAGTRMVRVIREGGAEVRHFEPLGDGRAVFWQVTTTGGAPQELWVTDGTRSGTRMIGDTGGLNYYMGSGLRSMGDGRALFLRRDHRGIEPWITDGTRAGTRLLRDIWRGDRDSQAMEFTVLGRFPAEHALVRALVAAEEASARE